jgi:hypothetical protein
MKARYCKTQDMKNMPNKNALSVKGDNGRAATQDRKVRVVTHLHLQSRGCLVRDESSLVGEHVIGSTRVGNGKATTRVRKDGRVR